MTPNPSPLAGALRGVRVLDLTRLLPGPYLTMLLADLGADVVKVEDPRLGDYMRTFPPFQDGMGGRFLAINRGKRSLALDLKAEAGRAAFLRMCETADIVVESFRPGVMARLGLDYETLQRKNRGVILCSLSGFGQTGPYRDRAGHDLNYVSLTGALAMTGVRSGAPVVMGLQVADLAGGALWGVSGILAALWQRERHGGHGAWLDISMTEGVLALLAAEFGQVWAGAEAPTRGQSMLTGGNANFAIYRTQDDRYLTVAAIEPKFWEAFNRAIGRSANPSELLLDGPGQEVVRAEVQEILLGATLKTWCDRLRAHDCCCEPVLELSEVLEHPQHAARQVVFVSKDGAGKSLRQLRTPLGAPEDPRPPPKLGQHTREVLLEYGFSADEISAL